MVLWLDPASTSHIEVADDAMNIDVGRKLKSPVTDKYTRIPISQGYFCSISLRVCHNGEYDLPVAFDAVRDYFRRSPRYFLTAARLRPGSSSISSVSMSFRTSRGYRNVDV